MSRPEDIGLTLELFDAYLQDIKGDMNKLEHDLHACDASDHRRAQALLKEIGDLRARQKLMFDKKEKMAGTPAPVSGILHKEDSSGPTATVINSRVDLPKKRRNKVDSMFPTVVSGFCGYPFCELRCFICGTNCRKDGELLKGLPALKYHIRAVHPNECAHGDLLGELTEASVCKILTLEEIESMWAGQPGAHKVNRILQPS
nr:hypothetical protein CFP56_41320 [Quercus suber]